MEFSKASGKYENDQHFQGTAGNILGFVLSPIWRKIAQDQLNNFLAVLSVAGRLHVSAFYMSETQSGSAPDKHLQCVLARMHIAVLVGTCVYQTKLSLCTLHISK